MKPKQRPSAEVWRLNNDAEEELVGAIEVSGYGWRTRSVHMHVPKPVNMIHRVLLLLSKRWSKQ